MKRQIPVVVQFTPRSRVLKTETLDSSLQDETVRDRFYVSEPPRTYVELACGTQIELPTDQIVLEDNNENDKSGATIGFGGMSFEGMHANRFMLCRVCDIVPEERLPVERPSQVMLDSTHVSAVWVQGVQVWPQK